MSLLLDARKKSQSAQGAGLELSLEEHPGVSPSRSDSNTGHPVEQARSAGQNLFTAKAHSPSLARAGVNRNLLIAFVATILLLALGGGYVWYSISASSAPPLRTVPPSASASVAPPSNLIPNITAPQPASAASPVTAIPRHTRHANVALHTPPKQPENKQPVLVEQHLEPIDPLLNSAYRDYRNGKFDQAQQTYREVLKLDERNTDALLGLAAIAQRRGEDGIAANYYAKVLALDPRNAVANSGMSELTIGDNRESHLKNLLNEQQDSASLHFALGNRYAEQSRWAEAQQAYFNAYRLEPDNAGLAFNLAISLDRLGQKKTAVQYYQRALQLDPEQNPSLDHKQVSQRIEELSH